MSTVSSVSKPILFSGPMVRAILEGRKTQTRRIVKPQPSAGVRRSVFVKSGLEDGHGREIKQRIFVGYLLWVRESFGWTSKIPCSAHRQAMNDGFAPRDWYTYKADNEPGNWCGAPSIHMPLWMSRLALKVTDVHIQRLQVISEADALAEGCKVVRDGCFIFPGTRSDDAGLGHSSAVMAYAGLWDEINGADSWNENPWVWAYTFEVVR